jgi:tetratricopeptide (TPR) repeat protein
MQKQNRIERVASRSLFKAALPASVKPYSRQFRNTAFLFALASLFSASSAFADSLSTDSVLITKHSNRAAEFYEKGNFDSAKDEYLAVIGFAPNALEPYEGLLSCAKQTKDWRQIAFAAEKISSLNPERKSIYEFDYGTALYHLNRFDEAIPHLKSALATADLPEPTFKPVKMEVPNGLRSPRIVPTDSPPADGASSSPRIDGNSLTQIERKEQENTVTSDSTVDWSKLENFENAIRSESICIVEYVGFDKKAKDIRYNSPVASYWHVVKILKGPPITGALPVRYDFHTLSEKQAPSGWRFDESKMPTKGSRWILFIEFSVPDGEKRLFKTYGASYGRQPATEENLNELDRLLESHNMRVQGL